MGMLKQHINEVGTDEALRELGPEVQGEGEQVEYEGGFSGMGDFAEQYLNRYGITPSYQLEPGADVGRRISAQVEDVTDILRPGRGDVRSAKPYLTNKLEEAKKLPGLEKSEDVHKIMGRQVDYLTPDVVEKMDERFGKGRWIIKAYGEEAFAGFGIFFPQRVEQIKRDAQNAIWESGSNLSRYGFSHFRENGRVVGIKHENGDVYRFGSKDYEDKIYGDARHWADVAREAAWNETGPRLPAKDFMAQPAFEAVGVSDADRAAGKTIAPGESRTHIVTRNGKAELIPHSTWIKGEWLPVVFEDDETRAMAQAALDAINALPEEARQGQVYAPDILNTTEGYKVVEANPSDPDTGSSGYLEDNPFIIDAYVSHLTGREAQHVKFIRRLLSQRKKQENKGVKGWKQPDLKEEQGEINRTGEDLGVDPSKIRSALAKAHITPLTDEIWSRLENTDSWDVESEEDARELADKYGRNIDRIMEGVRTGEDLPAPLIVIKPDGTPYLVGGNTRLMVARAMGKRPGVLIADLRGEKFLTRHIPQAPSVQKVLAGYRRKA